MVIPILKCTPIGHNPSYRDALGVILSVEWKLRKVVQAPDDLVSTSKRRVCLVHFINFEHSTIIFSVPFLRRIYDISNSIF